MKYIRNFSIIAHINHGKSTLSDRLIQICGGLKAHEMISQVLDSMELEREKGITIKSQSVTLNYMSLNNKLYQLNLIDTPGHVDFTIEVERSLSACEGAILVIDALQGIEAQTIANYRIAIKMNLKIIVVLNKIDLLISYPKQVLQDIENIIGIKKNNIILCSAKTGLGIEDILERLICDIPPPIGNVDQPLQALILDSWFNNYLGVVLLICIKNGKLNQGDILQSMSTKRKYIVDQIGVFTPKQEKRISLTCGEVGWLVCTSRYVTSSLVGDTLTVLCDPAKSSLPKLKKVQPYVYAGIYPISPTTYKVFSDALRKLSLNDSSLYFEPERSEFFGLGMRCGFLGLLHMEIICERLKREYLINLITTTPMVTYKILTIDNGVIFINNPSKFLSIKNKIREILEPIALCNILLPKKYLGEIMKLCIKKRGIQISLIYHDDNHVTLTYELPVSEIIIDFFDNIKSISKGYASFEYQFKRFQKSNIVCLELLINNKRIDTLSMIVHRTVAAYRGRILVNKLQSLVPRQQFNIAIQASVGKQVLCRSTVKQLRKNVIAKCYGGDVTRKKKLLYNQKSGKKRMKEIGQFNLPNAVFLSILNHNNL